MILHEDRGLFDGPNLFYTRDGWIDGAAMFEAKEENIWNYLNVSNSLPVIILNWSYIT